MSPISLPRGGSLVLEPFALMGVINATPDSFYPASRHRATLEARDTALAMVAAGATIIDIGGESSRPGAAYVSEDEELERVLPLVAALRAESEVAVSVDTRKTRVFKAALDAGADILNDIASLGDSPGLPELVAASGAPVVLMHMKGLPTTMQEAPYYADCLSEVGDFLRDAASKAMAAGIARDRIILDPGIGFGKRLEDNLALIRGLPELSALGFPLLIGLSRKSFIGALTGRPVEDRLAGGLGATAAAWIGGARLFRTHDVAETRDSLLTLSAALRGAPVSHNA